MMLWAGRRHFTFFIISLLWVPFLKSEEVSESPWKFSSSLLTQVSRRVLSLEELNSGNRVLQLPEFVGVVELRPNLEFNKNFFLLVVRPRFYYRMDSIAVADEATRQESFREAYLSDGYLQSQLSAEWVLTYGFQNFQWGPAELASPSNRIIHQTIRWQDNFFDIEGYHLLRLSFTPEVNRSFILLFEPGDHGEPEFEAKESYAKKVLLKGEVSWNAGSEYLGLVLGARENRGLWVGEYLSYSLREGLSFYLDASQERGSLAWYPENSSFDTIELQQSKKYDSQIYSYLVTGLRYSFENGNDLRGEWLYQEAGYSSEQQKMAKRALSPFSLVQLSLLEDNATKFSSLGLEFYGKQYFLLSLLLPDFLAIRDLRMGFRSFIAFSDRSSLWQTSGEYPVTDSGVVRGSLVVTAGGREDELRAGVSHSLDLGYRHTW